MGYEMGLLESRFVLRAHGLLESRCRRRGGRRLEAVPPGCRAAETPAFEINDQWWVDFGESDLARIVEIALMRNHDLLAEAVRVDQAAANAKIAGADLKPTVNVGLNGQRRKQNFIGLPIPGAEGRVLSRTFTTYGVSLDLSWELDLWDRLGARARAGIADLQAAAADFRGAQLSIAGQTVKAWFATAEAWISISQTSRNACSDIDVAVGTTTISAPPKARARKCSGK